ncbi:MAG: hypothetical protein RL758_261 [Pseudomonadota bacterium]|jgi:hypothetical protein
MSSFEQRVFEGNRAKEVLDNEAYQGAFELLKQELRERWESSPARDAEGREKLWLMTSLLNKLQVMLQTTLETGQLAELDLKHRRTVLERMKSPFG